MKAQFHTVTDSFIRAAAGSYPQANFAVNEFRRILCNELREGLKTELGALKEIIEISLAKLKDYSDATGDDSYAVVGLRSKGDDGWLQYFCLWWEEGKLYISTWMELSDSRKAALAAAAFREAQPKYPNDLSNGTEIWMRFELMLEGNVDVRARLRDLIGEWCLAWKRVPGGLKRFL